MGPLGWRLSAAQWDVLTETLQLERYPVPIQIRSHGRNTVERAHLRAEVGRELSRLGLMRAGRVDADLEAVLRLLHRPSSWLDSVWLPDAAADQPVRVLAARAGTVGICALQHSAQPGATVLDVIPASGLAAAVVSRLPAHPPGRSPAMTLVLAPSATRLPRPGGGLLVSASPGRTNVERSRVEYNSAAVASILDQPHARTGQIAANLRDASGRVRRSRVLRWCDNPDGRYQIALAARPDDSRSLTITPCDPHRLTEALRSLLNTFDH